MTSSSLRHKYIAAQLSARTNLTLIVTEEKSAAITDTSSYSAEDTAFLERHFASRAASEKEYFGEFDDFPADIPLLSLEHGKMNSAEVFEHIQKENPEIIVLFGTSIVKDPLLKEFRNRIVNLHLGLSPYYRGSATNLFPYLFEEPECVGATIHIATSEVDWGAVLHQLRPRIEPDDSLHSIGNRVILEAGKVLPEVLEKYLSGDIRPQQILGRGRLCRNKDFTPAVLREIYRNFEQGMIQSYIEEKEKRDTEKPLVKQL